MHELYKRAGLRYIATVESGAWGPRGGDKTMGFLESQIDGARLPLRACSLLGRHARCDIRIDNSKVSGEHAAVHWRGDRWELRDLGSRNGTFVDGRRLATGERVILDHGAAFSLSRSSAVFKLGDASAPPTAARNEATGRWYTAVAGLLALPQAQDPFVTIFATAEGQWMVESDEGTRTAVDGERLSVGGETYKLEVAALGLETLPSAAMSPLLDSVRLRLAVTPDEEEVEVTVFIGGQPNRLPKRRYHYLLTTLARAWLAETSAPPSVRGYVDRDDLCKKLQMDVNKLNVEIFRARKQIAALGVAGAAGLVERRPGTREIRIGIHDVEVVRL